MILKEAVNFAGRLYAAGEDVKGKLPLDFLELLKEKGKLEDSEQPTTPKLPDRPLWLTEEGTVLPVSGFTDLPASDQKELLKSIEIDPAGKVDERIIQYEEWFVEQAGNEQ